MANLTAANLETLMLEDLQANTGYQISCTTAGTTTITSSAAFGPVTVGMKVFGTGIVVGTTVTNVATTSSLTISIAATDSTTATRTFAADPPLTLDVTGETYILLNDAASQVWELWGGSIKRAASSTLWTPSPSNDGSGFASGLVAMKELLHVFATTTAPQSIATTTNGSTLITSSAGFGTVTAGMLITGTGIPSETFVAKVTDTSNITMTQAATDSTTTSRTFSPVTGTELDKAKDLAEIEFHRNNTTGLGTYTVPQMYHASMIATTTAANVGFLRLDYFPGVTGYYFPCSYIPQFTALAASSDVLDLPDLGQRDVAHLAAFNACRLIGRPEFESPIMSKISEKTRLLLQRKAQAAVSGDQDR